jgi:tetratricopeptide (TPR) repeat protein
LAEKQPNAYTADWASSFDNLANHLRDIGRLGEALKASEKAEVLLRGLAEKQPNAYTADWVRCLCNLSEAQLNAGQVTTALDTAKVATSRIGPLVERYPALYAPWLGFARRVAAEIYLKLKMLDEAVVEAREATQIWANIASTRSNFESRQVAKSFWTLMQCEKALGQNGGVLSTYGRALNLLRQPFRINPKPLEKIVLEIIELARSTDADASARILPPEFQVLAMI